MFNIFSRKVFLSATLLLSLLTPGFVAPLAMAGVLVFQDQTGFYAKLDPDTIGVVNFDRYPDGTPVPTGYDPAGNWSGFTLIGNEWSSLGVTFSTPSGQPMSTVNITENPPGTFWNNFSSPPNSLTPGLPPYVGYGVPPDTPNTNEDSLYIRFDPPRWAVGLVFVDNAPTGVAEHVEFRAADGSLIVDLLPSPATGYLSFLGIVSDIPVASIQVFEKANDSDDVSYDDIVFGIPTGVAIEATIDIKPGSSPNSINPRSNGVIPVAILTTSTFDATTVDAFSVKFGPAGATESHGRGHIEDVDSDGDLDLVLHFRTQDTGIQCGDTSASLTGKTTNDIAIQGSDSITTVGCK